MMKEEKDITINDSIDKDSNSEVLLIEVDEDEEYQQVHKPVIVNYFSSIIEYNEQDYRKRIDNYLDDYANDYEKRLNSDWFEYWQEEGEKYLMNSWQLHQKAYLANELQDIKEIYNSEDNVEKSINDQYTNDNINTIEDRIENNEQLIYNLWLKYRDKIYEEQYTIFSELYYQHYTYIRQTFLNSIKRETTASLLSFHKKVIPDIWTELCDDELERQKFDLGLPLSFCGGNKSRYSKYKKNNVKSRSYKLLESEEERDHNIIEDLIAVELDDNNDEHRQKSECTEIMELINNEQKKNDKNSADNKDNSLENEDLSVRSAAEKMKRKKRKNLHLIRRKVPSYILDDKSLLKFWRRRFSLFSRFDHGIHLDREGWFSVTPEKIAYQLATRLSCNVLVEGCCGCGGNAIQFARTCNHVIAIDNNPERLAMAKHNAIIYGVAEKIEFVLADFFDIAMSGRLKADCVFLSPPWGGPVYKSHDNFDIEEHILPSGTSEWMKKARCISENVALFLPRNSNIRQVVRMAGHGQRCEIIHNYLNSHLVAISAFFGEKIIKNETEPTVMGELDCEPSKTNGIKRKKDNPAKNSKD